MIEKISTAGMSRGDWLAERKHSLGGSDMGAVLGLNPYSSPVAVYLDKKNLVPDKPDNEAMRQGRDLEDYVARRFAELSGKKVERYNFLVRNPAAPYLHADIDRRIVGEKAGLECKTCSALSEKKYKGGSFPTSYYVQTVTYMAVLDYDRYYLAVLILGRGFQVYQMTTIPGDIRPAWCESSVYVSPEEIEALKAAAKTFWEGYVLQDEMPPADGMEATTDALGALYRGGEKTTVDLLGHRSDLDAYFELKDQIDALGTQAEEIKQNLMLAMGNAEKAKCDGYSISWAPQTRRTFNAKAFAKDHPGVDLEPYYTISNTRPFKLVRKEG